MALSDWDLQQVLNEAYMAQRDAVDLVCVPAKLVVDVMNAKRFRADAFETPDLYVKAKTVLAQADHAKRKYHNDQTAPGTLRIHRRDVMVLAGVGASREGRCALEDVRERDGFHEDSAEAAEPLDMTPVSVESIKTHLAEDPQHGWYVRAALKKMLNNVGLDGKPKVLSGRVADLRLAYAGDVKMIDEETLTFKLPHTADEAVAFRGSWSNAWKFSHAEAKAAEPDFFRGGYFMVTRHQVATPKRNYAAYWMRGTILRGSKWHIRDESRYHLFDCVYGLEEAAGQRVEASNDPMLTYLGPVWNDDWCAIADELWNEDGEMTDRPAFTLGQ